MVAHRSDLVRIAAGESRELFDRFITERVGPVMQQAGAAPPDMREFTVHEYLKP
jgi:hypothetical protein